MSPLLAVVLLAGLIVAPATAATFTQITQPDAAYVASTTKIDISGLTNNTNYSSITDGTLTVNFSTPMNKRGPVPSGWATWSSPPFSETANPHVLFTNYQTALTMTLSQPCTTFGFELEPNPFSNQNYTVDFTVMSGPTIVGTITMTVNGSYGARLFAGSVTGGSFDGIVINGTAEFAIAQVRYIPGIPVDIDIKPGSDPNSINLGSKGVVPVAILTTADFDAATVDPTTVIFAGASPVRWTDEDVDDDGDTDLLLHFKTQELALDGDSTDAALSGQTTGGDPIVGSDSVRIVPPKGKKNG
jgi:hypothetical protein